MLIALFQLNNPVCMTTRNYSNSQMRMALLFPQRPKFKKQQKGGSFAKVQAPIEFHKRRYGIVELRSLEASRLTAKQIEAMMAAINKIVKKSGRVTLAVFPDVPISAKPIEVRMGKGKGAVDHWVAKIRPGTKICEIDTAQAPLALAAMKSAQIRLPFKTKVLNL